MIASRFEELPVASRGVVMCAGGVTYLTNAYIALRLLRYHKCDLPVEVWYQDASELDDDAVSVFDDLKVTFRSSRDEALEKGLTPPTGWALKPFAMLHSTFDELLYLDSDNFVVRNPEYLFDSDEFNSFGAVFWPDLQKSSPFNKIWNLLGLFPRDEWEFESGQILINKNDFLEPLQFALQMNYDADKYYQHIWGDKDTFRFAWHKFNRSFAMPETEVELLTAASGPKNGGVMCQHDFEGRRIFQHRNILKWQLFGENPQVAGFLHEPLCRKFLNELRERWNGKINADEITPQSVLNDVAVHLFDQPWLLAGVGRVKEHRVTTTDNLYGMREHGLVNNRSWAAPESTFVDPDEIAGGIRLAGNEIRFLKSGRVEGLESTGLWYWQIKMGRFGDVLYIHGDRNVEMLLRFRDDLPFSCWEGSIGERDSFRPVRMAPFSELFPIESFGSEVESSLSEQVTTKKLLLTNSATGIGDLIHSLYVAVGAADLYDEVVLVSPRADWLDRACHPGVTVASELPTDFEGYETVNLGIRYHLMNRHGKSRLDWLSGLVGQSCIAARPDFVDTSLRDPIDEFSRYVVFAPFASREERNWSPIHWQRLTNKMEERGYQVVILGTDTQEGDIESVFSSSNAAWLTGLDPDVVCDILLGAEFVVGLDSGITHLCGLLEVTVFAIHSQMSPDFLFQCSPSVVSIFANGECAGCRWQPENGYNSACQNGCSELVGITAATVASTVDNALKDKVKPEKEIVNGGEHKNYSGILASERQTEFTDAEHC
ncbi:MAG: hypothetical protein CMO55_17130 [Verrucomicrobiales bacterium]|nr:hypothetical protein [Verrucomicrobiales bacterium]